MTLVAVDGGNPVASSTPSTTSIGLLYPGERMDIIVQRSTKGAVDAATTVEGYNTEMKQESSTESTLTITLDLEYVQSLQDLYILGP